MRKHGRTLAASLVLLFGLVWILRAGGLPLLPPAGSLDELGVAHFLGFLFAMVLHMLTRFLRYHFLIAPIAKLGLRRLIAINAIALGLITYLPFRLGELARPAMLREKGRLSAWAVTGTVGAERVLDGVLLSAMLLVGLALSTPLDPLPDRVGDLPVPAALVPSAARLAALVFGAAFVVMAVFYFARSFARRVTERVLGIVSQKLANTVAGIVERLSSGLGFLTNLRYSLAYLAVSIVSLAANVWAIELLAAAVGLEELTPPEASVVLGVVALGFSMPNAPGFFGTVQLALYAGLSVYILPEKVAHEGAAFVFLYYVGYLGVVTGLAALGLVAEYAAPARADQSTTP